MRRAGELLAAARAVVFLTGAGISTESGIPDFRSPGGVWSRHNPAKLTFDRFQASEETRRDYWRLAVESYPVLRDADPNPAHEAIVQVERAGRLACLVTQNIDGLHQKAGTSAALLIEIHGSALRAACILCRETVDREDLHQRLLAGEMDVPRCASCGGPIKPMTISFGQAMPEPETSQAFAAARAADLFVVVGSSLQVHPAASLPTAAVAAGASLVIVNDERTPKDRHADALLRGPAGQLLPRMLRAAGLGMP